MYRKNKTKVVALIQARMSSSRLPGKALATIGTKSVVEIIFERLRAAREIDDIILAIPDNKENDVLEAEGERIGIRVFRGSERDLISRLLYAAKSVSGASAFVRVTADCPLVDPCIVDQLVGVYRKNPRRFDYLTDDYPQTFPVGLNVEVFSLRILKKLDKILKKPEDREYFTGRIRRYPQNFRIYNLVSSSYLIDIRLTLDYKEDLMLIRKIYAILAPEKPIFVLSDILKLLKKKPGLLRINKNRIDYKQLIF